MTSDLKSVELSQTMPKRKVYHCPHLISYGTISKVTEKNGSIGGNDNPGQMRTQP